MTAPIRVLIADDQELVRSGLRTILEDEPDIEVVGEAGDGEEAVAAAARLRPDVVLMDIRMPRVDGLAATWRLAGPAARDRVKVVILTTYDYDEYVIDAVRAGASGFLLKDGPTEELLAAVRAVAAGGAQLSPAITRRLLDLLASRQRHPPPSPDPAALASLTEREREVMQLVARGWANAEIAEELGLAEATVKTHVSNLMRKLGLHDRVQVVVLGYETGLAYRGWSPQGGTPP